MAPNTRNSNKSGPLSPERWRFTKNELSPKVRHKTFGVQFRIRSVFRLLMACSAILFTACASRHQAVKPSVPDRYDVEKLQYTLKAIAGEYPAETGIALITDRADTVTVDNDDKYPLMSVFKLHQAVSLCHYLEKRGISLDSAVVIRRDETNPHTWSPMLKDYPAGDIKISIRELLRYTLMQSDNNASNYMFEHIQPVGDADAFTATLIPRGSFRLNVTEAQMWADHGLCLENHSSPLGAAILIDRLYTDSIIGEDNAQFIRTTLQECRTGLDRIVAPLAGQEGIVVGHKTGSGFRNEKGILGAHNDVAFVSLPDGRHYTIAVLVKDFNGSEEEAARAIARISAAVYDLLR